MFVLSWFGLLVPRPSGNPGRNARHFNAVSGLSDEDWSCVIPTKALVSHRIYHRMHHFHSYLLLAAKSSRWVFTRTCSLLLGDVSCIWPNLMSLGLGTWMSLDPDSESDSDWKIASLSTVTGKPRKVATQNQFTLNLTYETTLGIYKEKNSARGFVRTVTPFLVLQRFYLYEDNSIFLRFILISK